MAFPALTATEPVHARLSPSHSSSWLVCAGALEQDDPDYVEKFNSAAEIGTACHELSETCLVLLVDPAIFEGREFNGIEIEDEHISIADSYIEYVNDVIDTVKLSSDCYAYDFEHKMRWDNSVEVIFGTMDCYVIDHDNALIHIIDLKAGRVPVSAVENTQLMIYALGLTQQLGIKGYHYRLHIVQPRVYNYDSWDISYADLMAFGEYVERQAALTLLPNPPRCAGDKQCTWCANAPTCSTLRVYMDNIMTSIFDETSPMETLPLTDLAKLLSSKGLITQYLNKVEEYLITKAQAGQDLHPIGFKLVSSQTRRKFNDDAENVLRSKLGDKAFKPRALIGVTDASKLLGKDIISTITFKPEGNPVLAPLSDKRQELKAVSEMFEDAAPQTKPKLKLKKPNLNLLKGL